MYQRSDLKNLYDRLKAQYPQYGLDFSGDRLTMTRLHSKVEVDREGVKLYVNGELYDQFTSGDVDDPDDLYELLEAFLLDLQHAGMKQGNETYLAASKQAARMGSRSLILSAVCLTAVMIGVIATNVPWLFPLLLLIPAGSLVILKQIRKQVFQKSWVCPSCGQPLPMVKKALSAEMEYVPQCPHCGKVLEQAPDLEPIQREYSATRKPLEPAHDLPAPGSKWPCMISGGITIAFALFLLPLIFISDGTEPLDMVGVWTGVVMLLYLLGFGLALLLLLCKQAAKNFHTICKKETALKRVLSNLLSAVSLLRFKAVFSCGFRVPPGSGLYQSCAAGSVCIPAGQKYCSPRPRKSCPADRKTPGLPSRCIGHRW